MISSFLTSGSGAVALFWMIAIAVGDVAVLLGFYEVVCVIEHKFHIG